MQLVSQKASSCFSWACLIIRKEEDGIGQQVLVTAIRDRLPRHLAGWPKGQKLGEDRQVGGIGGDHSRTGGV